MSRLSGKVVAVTGASSGIGRATALALAAEGARLAVSARREDRLQSLVSEIAGAGGTALALPGDVSKQADMQALVEAAVTRFGRLDVMICNAGIGYHGTLEGTSAGAVRRLLDVNIAGTIYAAQAALAVMRGQKTGHIIAVSSIVGRRGIEGSSVYAATKAAQIALVESLRAEFVGSGLHASVVLPVATLTEFHEAIRRDFGHTVSGRGPRQPAEVVARAIVDCVVSPKPEVYTLRKARWLAILSVLAPGVTDRLVGRFARRSRSVLPDS